MPPRFDREFLYEPGQLKSVAAGITPQSPPFGQLSRDLAMPKSNALRYGPSGASAVHLCVDMQRKFAESTDWKMPWLERVLPNITTIAAAHPEHTIFTRFIPAQKPGQGVGMWWQYYERWHAMTIDQMGREMIDLVPDLARLVPPARLFDKHVYSPWRCAGRHDNYHRR